MKRTELSAEIALYVYQNVMKVQSWRRIALHGSGSIVRERGDNPAPRVDGQVLATAAVPALAAPRDLLPKTAQVRLTMPAGGAAGLRVRVTLAGNAPETTVLNNVASLPR